MEEMYPSQRAMFPKAGGGSHISPHKANTKFMMKKGAQQTTNVENTTPRTLDAFSSDTVDLEVFGGRACIRVTAELCFRFFD